MQVVEQKWYVLPPTTVFRVEVVSSTYIPHTGSTAIVQSSEGGKP